MTTEEAFEEMMNKRGIYHVLGIAHGTAAKMRSDMRAAKNNISLDKKIELLKKAGYDMVQDIIWKEPEAPPPLKGN
ncbi:MAG: hypothetical protein M3O67_10105 [Bacteroidota bacterium]|nr:hypothetical protein [Bacteroidota bacterium]